MNSAGLGEFGRIREFFAPLAGPGALGLTDDAALLACRPGYRLVVTVDAIVEGVHYLSHDPPELIAKKLLRVNLSDLAAMGARPVHYLLTTALPAALGDDWVERFASGLAQDQALFAVSLLGGDSVSTSGPASLTLTAIGEVEDGREIRRRGARPGDRIWVSGTIGDAYLGLGALRGDASLAGLSEPRREMLIARFRVPEPRTALGPRLAGIASAMCDVSDGLLADLGHICEASGCAGMVQLAALPLSEAAAAAISGGGVMRAQLATGGDDYELLFTAAPSAAPAIAQLARELRLPITEIGSIADGTGVRLLDAEGNTVPVATVGYRHF